MKKIRQKMRNDCSEIPHIITPILQSRSGEGIILFPAGWIHTGSSEAHIPEDAVCLAVTSILKHYSSDTLVCIGIDGKMDTSRFDHDQIALLIDKHGIKQRVRKFCASPQEKDVISHDLESFEEAKISHIFSFKGKNFFISVCYDICANKPAPKGIGVTNPGVNYILNLVHRFPKSGEGSGVWYFVRDNFGGASRDWKCPVFGTGIFIERDIADSWRSCVSWNLGNVPTNSPGITSDDFSIPYETIPRIIFPEKSSDKYAEVRFFDLSGLLQNRVTAQEKIFSSAGKPSILKDPQDNPDKIILPFIEACDRRTRMIPGLKMREFNNKNNPKQKRYFFPDWEKFNNRLNYSVYYEINDWNTKGKNEIRIDIQFWNAGFQEIGDQIHHKKDEISMMMSVQPITEWYIDPKNPQWSRLQFIFPVTTDPEIVAQSMEILINATKESVNNWLISKKLRHY